MLFDLTNTPATQQRFMETILVGLNWETCMVYIDDIVVFSSTFDEHKKNIEEILQRLNDHGVMIAPEKCSFCDPMLKILGYTFST